MSDDMPEWMLAVYSRPRLAPYRAHCDGDAIRAANLYHWNIRVSSAFYGLLHSLELALRNSMHNELTAHFEQADWWTRTSLQGVGPRLIDEAIRKCRRRPSPMTPDDVITELNFGFWTSLLTSGYDRLLWRTALHRAFPGYRGPRTTLRKELDYLRVFRNRIMHHEPIHHRHLDADHATIHRMLSHISPAAAAGIKPMDRVPEILLIKEQVCQGVHPPSF